LPYDDCDDFDEAEWFVREEALAAKKTAYAAQIFELNYRIRNLPLPGMRLPEFMRREFGLEYLPLEDPPTPGKLRNLYSELACIAAQECVDSCDINRVWMGGQFFFWRSVALGKFCYNTQCVERLPQRGKRRGRPRYYCEPHPYRGPNLKWIREGRIVNCKESGTKRHRRNAENPHRTERLSAMLVPGHPFSVRPIRRDDVYKYHRTPGSLQDDEQRVLNGEPLHVPQFFNPDQGVEAATRQWIVKHKKIREIPRWRDGTGERECASPQAAKIRDIVRRIYGCSVEELIGDELAAGNVIPDDLRSAIEEAFGQTLEVFVGLDEAEAYDADEGPDPLTIGDS
jgi:hypothetical protein